MPSQQPKGQLQTQQSIDTVLIIVIIIKIIIIIIIMSA
jgi:hypothetical protein